MRELYVLGNLLKKVKVTNKDSVKTKATYYTEHDPVDIDAEHHKHHNRNQEYETNDDLDGPNTERKLLDGEDVEPNFD